MTGTFFDRLETELAGLTREGAHRDPSVNGRHRLATVLRRGMLAACVAAVLAVSLTGEFPGTASGHVLTKVTVVGQSL